MKGVDPLTECLVGVSGEGTNINKTERGSEMSRDSDEDGNTLLLTSGDAMNDGEIDEE